MRLSNIKVEQINEYCQVVDDYGEILSKDEMQQILTKCFEGTEYRDGCVYGERFGKRFCIYFKNVSYLGIPHPYFKKRIQIGDNFKDIYRENETQGIMTLLLGIYKYERVILFVDFDVTRYIGNKSHNSSAHVYTIDLKNGLLYGIFQKEDNCKNIITTFTPQNVEKYLRSKTDVHVDLRLDFIAALDDFYMNLPKEWYGIHAYQEMLSAGFNNALQPEWPGFYQEFRLQRYIIENHASDKIEYRQNKKKDDIDLDLYFPQISAFGDLKAHSNDSSGIQGNDWDTIMSLIERKSVFYVVCNHNTERDRNHCNEVTIFWNTALGKKNILSYADKMKHSVTLTSYYVLEINRFNKQYLDVFHQGHNSNGKPRNPKITIKSKNIGNFLIHQIEF